MKHWRIVQISLLNWLVQGSPHTTFKKIAHDYVSLIYYSVFVLWINGKSFWILALFKSFLFEILWSIFTTDFSIPFSIYTYIKYFVLTDNKRTAQSTESKSMKIIDKSSKNITHISAVLEIVSPRGLKEWGDRII